MKRQITSGWRIGVSLQEAVWSLLNKGGNDQSFPTNKVIKTKIHDRSVRNPLCPRSQDRISSLHWSEFRKNKDITWSMTLFVWNTEIRIRTTDLGTVKYAFLSPVWSNFRDIYHQGVPYRYPFSFECVKLQNVQRKRFPFYKTYGNKLIDKIWECDGSIFGNVTVQ